MGCKKCRNGKPTRRQLEAQRHLEIAQQSRERALSVHQKAVEAQAIVRANEAAQVRNKSTLN